MSTSTVDFDKLNKSTKADILKLRKNGGTQTEIMGKFNINRKTFNDVMEEHKAESKSAPDSTAKPSENESKNITSTEKPKRQPRGKKSATTPAAVDPELSKMMKQKKSQLEKTISDNEKVIADLQSKVKTYKVELRRIDAYLSQ